MSELRLQTAVEVAGLRLELDGRRVLQDVSFRVVSGEYCCLVGPNGAGKSTVLKCLERFHDGWSGRIRLDGRDVRSLSRMEMARLVGYVPQIKGQLPDYEVGEFLNMSRYAWSGNGTEAVREALALVGLSSFVHRRMGTLSGGECQKVFIAAGLVQDTPVLLLDEPASFLDPRCQAETDRLLKRVNRQSGKTILCVTHDLNAALRDADRIVALKDGRTAFVKTPVEVWQEKSLDGLFDTPFSYFRGGDAGRLMVAAADMDGD